MNAVKRADLETLKALSWLPDEVAENVFRALHSRVGDTFSGLSQACFA